MNLLLFELKKQKKGTKKTSIYFYMLTTYKMLLKRKITEKILLKEKRTCYKARIFSNGRLGESKTDFEIYEIDKDLFIVFVNGIKRYSCYNLGNAKSFCLGRSGYFTLINS